MIRFIFDGNLRLSLYDIQSRQLLSGLCKAELPPVAAPPLNYICQSDTGIQVKVEKFPASKIATVHNPVINEVRNADLSPPQSPPDFGLPSDIDDLR